MKSLMQNASRIGTSPARNTQRQEVCGWSANQTPATW